MNTFKRIAGGLLLAGVVGLSACVPTPVQYPPLPVERIQAYYSEAAQTQAIDTSFYEVKDANGNLLGTVLFSMPFTNDVKGFNGPTPRRRWPLRSLERPHRRGSHRQGS